MRWVVVRAVRFMTPLWQILTLKRSPGTRTGLFAFNSRIVGNSLPNRIVEEPLIRPPSAAGANGASTSRNRTPENKPA